MEFQGKFKQGNLVQNDYCKILVTSPVGEHNLTDRFKGVILESYTDYFFFGILCIVILRVGAMKSFELSSTGITIENQL